MLLLDAQTKKKKRRKYQTSLNSCVWRVCPADKLFAAESGGGGGRRRHVFQEHVPSSFFFSRLTTDIGVRSAEKGTPPRRAKLLWQ